MVAALAVPMCQAPAGAKELKVFGFGNSAWPGPKNYLPEMARAAGHSITLHTVVGHTGVWQEAAAACLAGPDGARSARTLDLGRQP